MEAPAEQQQETVLPSQSLHSTADRCRPRDVAMKWASISFAALLVAGSVLFVTFCIMYAVPLRMNDENLDRNGLLLVSSNYTSTMERVFTAAFRIERIGGNSTPELYVTDFLCKMHPTNIVRGVAAGGCIPNDMLDMHSYSREAWVTCHTLVPYTTEVYILPFTCHVRYTLDEMGSMTLRTYIGRLSAGYADGFAMLKMYASAALQYQVEHAPPLQPGYERAYYSFTDYLWMLAIANIGVIITVVRALRRGCIYCGETHEAKTHVD